MYSAHEKKSKTITNNNRVKRNLNGIAPKQLRGMYYSPFGMNGILLKAFLFHCALVYYL